MLDALAAFGVGFLLSAVLLGVFGVLHGEGLGSQNPWGKVSLCAAPAAIGALLAGKQLGERGLGRGRRPRPGRWASCS